MTVKKDVSKFVEGLALIPARGGTYSRTCNKLKRSPYIKR